MRAVSFHRCRFVLLVAGLLSLGTASTGTAAPVRLPDGKTIERVDFERHVMGLFGKMGCNAGSCHGSFQGKGGFRLSLFGYDPSMDYVGVTRDSGGRRINRPDPDRSLLLLKATGQIEHGGMRRFAKGSWQYQLLREWIVAGMPWQPGSGQVKSVTVSPPELAFKKSGEEGQLSVRATFADGTEEDITPLCDFRVNDEAIASASSAGRVKALQAGDTAVIVSYRGSLVPVRVLVPMTPPPGFKYVKPPEVNYIDREVFAKLRRLNIAPSDLCDDAAFLRRLTIDTTGSLPTPEEVRRFLADKDPRKREKKIDELLKHPLHAALWATKFSDITGNNTDALENPQQLKPKLSQMWHDWIRKRFQENVPYDKIVHDMLCATSRDGQSPEEWAEGQVKLFEQAAKGFETSYADKETLDLFWRRQRRVPVEQWGEKTAVAFLGVRLECAQCHKHPFDRWTQDDYWGYANIFSGVNSGVSSEARQAVNKANKELRGDEKRRNRVPQLREVYLDMRRNRMRPNPETREVPAPKALGGPQIKIEPDKDPREALFKWMSSSENPYFARSFVNRVWGHYFGIGIVHPVDDFSLANPPSNDKLLDALAEDFIRSGYNIRKLEKTILLSRTYQLSSATNETNELDANNYSHSYVRPLMAEVVVDVINDALGYKDNFGNEAPRGARAIEIGSSRIRNAALREAFRVFGRSTRSTACDCDRSSAATVSHKLYLMADPTLQAKFEPNRNRIKDLVAGKKDNAEIIEELFLCSLSRLPTKAEKQKALEYVAEKKDRRDALADVLWALINTTEFIFNH